MNSKILKQTLWNNDGWKNYFATSDEIRNKLSKYASVNSLPEDITEQDLMILNDNLKATTEIMKKLSSMIK